jgi:2-oxoglutarate ferredoxin oxidoreductase subunit alpha
MEGPAAPAQAEVPRKALDAVVIRFAGDSGDGIQLTGGQFAQATALAGNDLQTFPDFPAEIRAPTGTKFGVSAFQINFSAKPTRTSGDEPDVLVALNPAALAVNLDELTPGGLVIVDAGTFSARNLEKAGYTSNPLEDGSLAKYRKLAIDISKMTLAAVENQKLSQKEALRCKNMWTLGLVFWLYGRRRKSTTDWLEAHFKHKPELAAANIAALNAGHAFGETAELSNDIGAYQVPSAELPVGTYRNITGTEALAWGLVTGTHLAKIKMVFCSYPITPASGLLHSLARLKEYDVVTFQAEDEIAAACAAIGASYAGSLGVTSSSGPGIALKTEAIGLAIATELPIVIVNSQRAGPSTGLPTKTEQSDLYQAVFGRNADSPLVVLAANSPSDCFEVAIEAVRLATKYMTPVIILSDSYIANASEPWHIPAIDQFAHFPVRFLTDKATCKPFARDTQTLARPWIKPGTPNMEHRIGGLEKDYDTGHISYDAENHQRMTNLRFGKIDGVANDIPLQDVEQGAITGKLAVVGWGSTFGPISHAVSNARADGIEVSHIHLRHIWPLPHNLGGLLAGFEQVLVPEMNHGQLVTLLRSQYLSHAESLSKVTGKPFTVHEIEDEIRLRMEA